MIVMPGNWSKSTIHYWAGRYPDALGHLYSPGSQRGPYGHLPYALDNGRFSCWSKGVEWGAKTGETTLDVYRCGECGWLHVGKSRFRRPQ